MDEILPSRRRFLSAGLAAGATAVAGCLDEVGSEGADEGRSLVLALSHGEGSLRESSVVDLGERRPERSEEPFAAVLAGEQYTTQHRRPFYSTAEDPKYAVHDGTYYRLGAVSVGERAERRPVLRLREADDGEEGEDGNGGDGGGDASGGDESSEDGGGDGSGTVPAEDLLEADRRAARIAHMAARVRGNPGGLPWGLAERGGYVYRREAAVEASRLLADDGPDRVAVRETTHAVEVTRGQFHEAVYRATAEPVADSPEEMEAVLRAKFLDARITREDLSEEARRIPGRARGEVYAESHPYSTAYRSVLEALREYPYRDANEKDATTGEHGHGTVRYDGEHYDYRLRSRNGES